METEFKTIPVLLDRLPEARVAFEKLIRKAHRYGCPDITMTVGEPYNVVKALRDWDGETRDYIYRMVDLVVTGEAPRVGSYEFLARVEFTEGGVLIQGRPGAQDVDAKYRHTDGHCDHCKVTRARGEVFVVRNLETGAQLQVGRSCLRDFLGVDSPEKVAHRFSFWGEVNDQDGHYGAALEPSYSTEGLLKLAAVTIRMYGWCSKGQAANDERLTPTIAYVLLVARPPQAPRDQERAIAKAIRDGVTEADGALARTVMSWVAASEADSDYMHNLQVLLGSDQVAIKRAGMAISAVAAYHRAMDLQIRRTQENQAAAQSTHVGTVGERLRDVAVTFEGGRAIASDFGDMVLLKFKDQAGNVYTWFTGRGLDLNQGQVAKLTGTVKRHTEYKGHLETQLTRCKVVA